MWCWGYDDDDHHLLQVTILCRGTRREFSYRVIVSDDYYQGGNDVATHKAYLVRVPEKYPFVARSGLDRQKGTFETWFCYNRPINEVISWWIDDFDACGTLWCKCFWVMWQVWCKADVRDLRFQIQITLDFDYQMSIPCVTHIFSRRLMSNEARIFINLE